MRLDTFHTFEMAIEDLKPHPRNYQTHSDSQLQHLKSSILEHGFYRNIIVAKDGTILAGHGVTAAATELGIEKVPVIQLDIDPGSTAALRVLVSDNEISRMSDPNEYQLLELLKSISQDSSDTLALLGTGILPEEMEALSMLDMDLDLDMGSLDSLGGVSHADTSHQDQEAPDPDNSIGGGTQIAERVNGEVAVIHLSLMIHITSDEGITEVCDRLGIAEPSVSGKSAVIRWPPQGFGAVDPRNSPTQEHAV
jgi:hypothetical protein